MIRPRRRSKYDECPAEALSDAERQRLREEIEAERAALRRLGTYNYFVRLDAVRWIAEGRSYSDVTGLAGILMDRPISPRTVARWVRTVEEKGPDALHDRSSRPATAAQLAGAKIRRLHAAGVGTVEIARRLRLGRIAVRRYLAFRERRPIP